MPIQVSFSTDNLTPEEARWIASLVGGERRFAVIPGMPEGPSEFSQFVERGLRDLVEDNSVQIKPGGSFDLPAGVSGTSYKHVATLPEIERAFQSGVLDSFESAPLGSGPVVTDAHHPEAPPVPVGVDSTGLQWDERIHASSKAVNADGSWRTKRGVDKALVASVEAELRTAAAPFEGVNDDPDELERVEGEVKELLATAPAIVPPPPPPAPEAPIFPVPSNPTLPGTSPFVALMKRVTTAQSAGKLTQPRVKELLESMEKKSIMDLRTDEDAQAAFGLLLDGEGV